MCVPLYHENVIGISAGANYLQSSTRGAKTMAYYRRDVDGEWTTEALLDMALTMLETARDEHHQAWLTHNSTMSTIRTRVESFGKPLFENAPK